MTTPERRCSRVDVMRWRSELARALLEVSRLAEHWSVTPNPVRDPFDHLLEADLGWRKAGSHSIRVAEKGVGFFLAAEANCLSERGTEGLSDVAHGERVDTRDVDDKGGRRCERE